MHTIGRLVLLVIATYHCTACTSELPVHGVAVRDSSGTRIVENYAPSWQPAEHWQVPIEPVITIGQSAGPEEYQFYNIRGVTRLANGSVAVANAGNGEIRFYDADGRFLLAVGQAGDGPGEFRQLVTLIRLQGDSLLLYDAMHRRATILSSEGDFVRLIPFSSGPMKPLGLVGRLLDGSFVGILANTQGAHATSGVIRDTLDIVMYSESGTFARLIGRLPGADGYLDPKVGAPFPLPFGQRSPAIAARNSSIIAGGSRQFELRKLGHDGSLRGLFRKEHEPRRVGPKELRRFEEDWLTRVPSSDWQPTVKRLLSAMPIPERMPPFEDVIIDQIGNIWAGEYRLRWEHGPIRWFVFTPTGRWLGEVKTPSDLDIYEIGEDYILGAWTDEQDIEYVRMHRLVKPTQ